jgi:hypothetical protein
VKRKKAAAVVAVLVVIIVAASFLAASQFASVKQEPEFFVGVEYAYSYPNGTAASVMVDDVKVLVDRVKNFTNLFVFGNPQLTFNATALDEACSYVRDAGLYFIVLLTGRVSYPTHDYPFQWVINATQRYGDRFLGVYRFDEPGGNQLDQGDSALFSAAEAGNFSYGSLAKVWTGNLTAMLNAYANATYQGTTVYKSVFTSDYGLYWFDYTAGYDVVFAEFGANQSRQRNIALCRGAASSFGRDWGAIVTWTFDGAPYLEGADALYSDLAEAYCCGAKYAVVFDYPNNQTGQPYGILTEEHLGALEQFWSDIHTSGPAKLMREKVNVAYILPVDFGFGFRSASDTVWGLWSAGENGTLAGKVYGDVEALAAKYDCAFDVVYDYPAFQAGFSRYGSLLYWNATLPP